MRKFVLGSIIIVPILAWVLLNSLRFSPLQAVSAHKFYGGDNVEIVKSQPTHYGKAVLLENQANNTFGVAGLNKKLGIFWRAGGSSFKQIDEQQPFNVAGIFSSNEKAIEQFIIGGKVKDERIKYFAFGRGPQVPITQEPYNLTLEEVRNMSDTYTVAPVQNNAVLAVLDEVNESNWTITAFDKDGNLIADKLPGSKARLIESNSFDIVSLKEKRVKTNPEQVDNLMKQLGMKRAQVQETFKMTDGKNRAVDDAVIINQVFQKGDYIYADISLRGNKLSDGDKIRVTYDHTEVYEIDFLHSKNLKLSDDSRIFEVTNATQKPWFGFLVKRRSNNKVAIPFIVTLETETGKYFWRYANVILSL